MAEVAYATGPALLGAPRFAQFRFFSAGPKKCEAPKTARPRTKVKKRCSKIKKRGTANEKARRRGPKT